MRPITMKKPTNGETPPTNDETENQHPWNSSLKVDIFKLGPEKQFRKQILNQKINNAPDFGTKSLERVRFLFKNFETCQNLKENFWKVPDFGKGLNLRHYVFNQLIPWKRHISHFSCFFSEAWFWNEKITTRQIIIWGNYSISDFEWKTLHLF